MTRPVLAFPRCLILGACMAAGLCGTPAFAAGPYPFEGTWIRADRACTAGSPVVRTYTARDVTSPRGRCAIRRVAQAGSQFELQEECRTDRRTVTEMIRMTSPDTLVLKRQVSRLKIPRGQHYARCTAAAPAAAKPVPHPVSPRSVPTK